MNQSDPSLRKRKMRIAAYGLSVLAWMAFATAAAAQVRPDVASWPIKPIRIIAPVVAGSILDLTARIIAPKVAEQLGQPVIVENRPGADMGIGTSAVVRSAPDGLTWLMASQTLITNPLVRKVDFDPLLDLTPIAQVGSGANVAVVPSSLGVSTMAEFVALAKANPGALAYANPAYASVSHLNTELFAHASGIQLLSVPYNGAAASVADLLSNRVNFMMVAIGVAAPYIKAGKLVALGVSSSERQKLLPEVPSMNELGYPEAAIEAWTALFVPAATPKTIVDRANAALIAALRDPATAAKLQMAGLTPVPARSAAGFQESIRMEARRWPAVLDIARIKKER